MDAVYLRWFEKEMPDGEDDIELLIGVYRREPYATAAIARVKNQKGFRDFPEGFHSYRYPLDRDHWTEGFIID